MSVKKQPVGRCSVPNVATLTGQELVKLALERLGDGKPANLVRALRLGEVMDSVDPAAQVRRWRDGKHEPSYAVTMRLLEGLGMLRAAPAETGAAEHSSGSSERPPDVLLAELVAAAEAMLRTQQTLVDDLAETHTRLQRLEAAQPAASARRSGKVSAG